MKRCICSLTVGIIAGMAMGFYIYPDMDRNCKKNIKRVKRKVQNAVRTSCDSMKDLCD